MSDKELRVAALGYRNHLADVRPMRDTPLDSAIAIIDKALAAPPDVVKVLRWLKEKERSLPLNTPIDADWYAAFKVTMHHIEQAFHVRLTDDGKGWEWTEDVE